MTRILRRGRAAYPLDKLRTVDSAGAGAAAVRCRIAGHCSAVLAGAGVSAGEVERQHLGVTPTKVLLRLAVERDGVSRLRALGIFLELAAGHVHVGQPRPTQRLVDDLVAVDHAGAHARVGPRGDRAVLSIGRGHQMQASAPVGSRELLLLAARCAATFEGQNPDLLEMRRALGVVVELAGPYADAATRARLVYGAYHPPVGRTDLAVVLAVLVRQGAVGHAARDPRVAVVVSGESPARCDAVLVGDAQIAHTQVPRVVVIGKRVGMAALEPAVIGAAPFGDSRTRTLSVSIARYWHSRTAGLVRGRTALMYPFK